MSLGSQSDPPFAPPNVHPLFQIRSPLAPKNDGSGKKCQTEGFKTVVDKSMGDGTLASTTSFLHCIEGTKKIKVKNICTCQLELP